jgi:phosphatidylserine/phosphatidylglycerophosphate/cardiolipin synthase-like enzyme
MRTHIGKGAGNHIEKHLFCAKKYVCVCSPFISPSYTRRLLLLLSSGVKIRVITSDSDNKDRDGATTRDLLKQAIKQPKDFLGRQKKDWIRPSLDYKVIQSDFIHAKIYVVDGELAMVGSCNLTHGGLWKNIEHLIITESTQEAKMIENDYERLWSSYGGDMTVDEHLSTADKIWNRIKGSNV